MTESLTAAQPGPIASVCQIVLILLKWELQNLFSIISSILSLLDAFKDICECVLNKQIMDVDMLLCARFSSFRGQSGRESIFGGHIRRVSYSPLLLKKVSFVVLVRI